MEDMTPQQALEILTNVTGMVQASRADHVKIQQALVILQEALQPAPAEDKALAKKA